MINEDQVIAKLRDLSAREEIRETLMRYCRGVDRADEDLINSAFHPDAIDDHGTPAPATDLARRVKNGRQPQMMHFTGNVSIELDRDTAYVESYFISFAPHDADGHTSTRTRAGRYLDRFEHRDGGWKIAHRMVIDEWARLDELTGVPQGVGAHRGSRGPDDPVFHLRELGREDRSEDAVTTPSQTVGVED